MMQKILYIGLILANMVSADISLQTSWDIGSQWDGGYIGHVTITNNSQVTISSWRVQFTLPSGQTVASLWEGVYTQNNRQIIVTNKSWNGMLSPSKSITFGFEVNTNGSSANILNLSGTGAGINSNPTGSQNPFLLNATYTIDESWGTGYQLTVTLKNSSSQPTTSWIATFSLPVGQSLASHWDGVYSTQGQAVTVKNPTWSGGGTIPANGKTTFGMTIRKPSSATATILNLQATANGSSSITPPPIMLAAPVLNSINNAAGSDYSISWSAVSGAQGYLLQQSSSATFAQSQTLYQGSNTSYSVSNQSVGTYYYRVIAYNGTIMSVPSNIQSVTVNQVPPPSSSAFVESYWESWNTRDSINTIVQMQVDIIDIAFVNFQTIGTHIFTVSGLNADQATLTQFIMAAHAAGKKVKISVGGATYGLSGQLLTSADADGMAQAIAQFVFNNSLDGVDYDFEDYPAPNLQVELLAKTRQLLGNNALITYTPKAPASTTYPYAQVIKAGYQYVNSINIMAYDYGPGYTYQADVQALQAMGVPASKIGIGLMPGYDDIRIFTSLDNISAVAQYILQKGLAGIMFWDLNRDHENITGLGTDAATNTAWNILH